VTIQLHLRKQPIVTGDRHLLALGAHERATIVTLAAFLQETG
jgi:predicted nucleic acid-binding protein